MYWRLFETFSSILNLFVDILFLVRYGTVLYLGKLSMLGSLWISRYRYRYLVLHLLQDRVTRRIFTIGKCFHRSKPKFFLLFSPYRNKAAKKFINYRRIYRKYLLIWFLRPSNKLFISWHNPFKEIPVFIAGMVYVVFERSESMEEAVRQSSGLVTVARECLTHQG